MNDDKRRKLSRRSGRFTGEALRVEIPVHQFLRNKRQEWEEYRSEVTAFELRKNLPVL